MFLPSFTSPASYNGSAGRLQAAAPATSIRSQAPAAAAVDQIPLHRSVLCQQPSSEFHMPVVQPTTCMPQCEQTAADTTSRHKMITRSKTGSLKPKTFLSTSNISSAVSSEPKTVKQALSDPKWYSAMQEEFRALQSNNTWSLVPHSSDKRSSICVAQPKIKEFTQELQSIIRLRGDMKLTSEIKKYLISRKAVRKAIKKALANSKAKKLDNDNESQAMAGGIMKEVEAISLTGFKSLLSFIILMVDFAKY
ncbi:hypothetical protein LWI29_034831 [Acer saccharum]|uniref:Uncharacterized protein n=1 Tax=Acer saccharum TaxID=4024 RepID=A0AA39SZH2_ACESA|nr:hypothetical protein LWI29_034831 [Acer saccharum]